jgi:pimeloyl-ACP methyl ester carboxylesterase
MKRRHPFRVVRVLETGSPYAYHAVMRTPSELASFARTTSLPALRGGLFYYDAGSPEAPPLVLVHGLGDEADTWRHVIGPLSRTYRVIAIDLPGFGRSSLPHRCLLTPPYLCRVILELLDVLGAERAVFMGSSLGASLVQAFAVSHPERVSRLILLDGGLSVTSRLPRGLITTFIPGLGESHYRSLEGSPDAAYASLAPYYADLAGLPESDRLFLRERVVARVQSATQRRAYFAYFRGHFCWASLRGRGWVHGARGLRVPTTRVWGAADLILPVAAARAAEPAAPIFVIEGSGHLPQQEKPEKLLEILDAERLRAGY